MDTISSNKDQGISHSATVTIDTMLITQEAMAMLNEPCDTDVLRLVLRDGEKIVWTSSAYNYMEYNFEVIKNDENFEERQSINFLIR